MATVTAGSYSKSLAAKEELAGRNTNGTAKAMGEYEKAVELFKYEFRLQQLRFSQGYINW